jgi:hypothetical protein
VLGLLPQKGECPVYRLVECLRLNSLKSLDPARRIQEMAAENAHSSLPRKPLDEEA